jgi:hypothetical protein
LKAIKFILFFFLLSILQNAAAQEIEHSEVGLIYKRERSMNINLNTDGWGFGYRIGFFKTGYVKRTLDISFSFMHDLKEQKYYNPADNSSKSFIYGKERNMYSLKLLYGKQKDLSNKPYWGGVDIRWLNLFGFNLAIGKPIYLYVVDRSGDNILVIRKYDPDMHTLDVIYGRAPYVNGLEELEFYPSISFKTALNVEYGAQPEKTRAIEAGLIVNGYLIPYNIMAYQQPKYFDFSFYVSFQFGKRYNP